MSFLLKVDGREIVVTRCGDCPRNVKVPRGHLLALKDFPWIPSHHCADSFDPMWKEGRLLINPNIIPEWCPHVPA